MIWLRSTCAPSRTCARSGLHEDLDLRLVLQPADELVEARAQLLLLQHLADARLDLLEREDAFLLPVEELD